jgi:NAD(P)-dependent dehydrogenase (short-subunit alcohol dehydrogenase family)
MDLGLTGRVAIVTGGSRGIGRAIAKMLASEGVDVAICARQRQALDGAAKTLAQETGRRIIPIVADTMSTESVAQLVDTTLRTFGRVDVLVNNAAIHYDTWQSAVDADLTVVREALETNLLGAWQATQALVALLRVSDRGRIVNVSSEAGSLASMGGGIPAYRASKAALNALTRMLAAELAGDGVLVNSVCPGWVATDMGGPGGRPVEEGAASVLWAVDLPDDGPTGGFFRDGRPVPF